jgi:phosphatidylserine/phosphatidylglycerophosphate/cardiolipin synthase-like enzyme
VKPRSTTPLRTHLAAWAALLLVAAVACLLFFGEKQSEPTPAPTERAAAGSVQVFFSRPDDPASKTLRGGPDATLAADIESAKYSVDLATYRLDLWSIRDALLKAARSGVQVRVVVEGDNADAPEIEALEAAGIPVVADQHPALMHDKFVVIDTLQVWTGSMNFTINGAYRNNNNLVHIQSRELASLYDEEFEEMFISKRFGALSEPDPSTEPITLGDGWVEVLFSPDSDVERRLDTLLGEAKEEIDLLVFNFTSDLLAETLLERADAGVVVRGVFERTQAENTGGEYDALLAAGADVRLDSNPDDMHHKVMIIDHRIVVTGSYNFSRAARDENDENLLIILSPALAQEYLIEFSRLFAMAGS